MIDKIIAEVESSSDELVELLQSLVRIPTVNTGVVPTGNELELCKYLKRKFDSEGIESEIVESAPNRGNFIARLGCNSGQKAGLMLMSHTDVVPIGDESKWIHPPFSGAVDNGRIYGRGADDCKSLVACEAMTMMVMKRLKIPLVKGLIFAAGCDEETGSKFGFHWLARNRKDLIQSEFAINEGGGETFKTKKGIFYSVSLGEKGRLDVTIKFKGKSCHASVPWEGDNALIKTAKAIERISKYEPSRDVSSFAFEDLAKILDVNKSEITPENVDRILDKVYSENPLLGSMLKGLSRMTITPTMVSGGIKSNVVPDTFTLTCDVRLLPGQDIDYVKNELKRILGSTEDLEISIQGTPSPLTSPTEPRFLNAIENALRKVIGTDVHLIRSITVGLTDSCAVRKLGTVIYNFAPIHPDSDPNKNNVHGDNESISIKDIIFRTKVLCALAYELLANV